MGQQLDLDEYSDDPDIQEHGKANQGAASVPEQESKAEKPKRLAEEYDE